METEDTDFNLRLRSFIDMNSNFSGPLTHLSYVVDDLLWSIRGTVKPDTKRLCSYSVR